MMMVSTMVCDLFTCLPVLVLITYIFFFILLILSLITCYMGRNFLRILGQHLSKYFRRRDFFVFVSVVKVE